MKRNFLKAGGFTLIELLVVISIIAILAGLTLPLVSFANRKAGMERAKTEIAGLSAALESYKADNGDYPRSSDAPTLTNLASEKLNARTDPGMTAANSPNQKYIDASLALYIGLSGDLNRDGLGGDIIDAATNERGKIYFDFKQNMLSPRVTAGTTRGGDKLVTALVDPFRNAYGYSTITTKASPVAGEGYNPTFDLWCTVDISQNQTAVEVAPADIWIKNW